MTINYLVNDYRWLLLTQIQTILTSIQFTKIIAEKRKELKIAKLSQQQSNRTINFPAKSLAYPMKWKITIITWLTFNFFFIKKYFFYSTFSLNSIKFIHFNNKKSAAIKIIDRVIKNGYNIITYANNNVYCIIDSDVVRWLFQILYPVVHEKKTLLLCKMSAIFICGLRKISSRRQEKVVHLWIEIVL